MRAVFTCAATFNDVRIYQIFWDNLGDQYQNPVSERRLAPLPCTGRKDEFGTISGQRFWVMPSRKHPPRSLQNRLWLLVYAKQSFDNARIACDYISKEGIQQADPIYYPLMASAHVFYARPFGRSRLSGSITSQ
jgi:hypothetical protein